MTQQDRDELRQMMGSVITEMVPGIVRAETEPHFTAIRKDFDRLDDRFEVLEIRFNNQDKRLNSLARDVSELRHGQASS